MKLPGTTTNADVLPHIYAAWRSLSEESGLAPAYMIGIAGCDRGCIFCHAPHFPTGDFLTGDFLTGDFLTGDFLTGDFLTGETLATHFARARESGCRTIQFTGGEPGLCLPELVAALPPSCDLPLVLNTSLSRPLHLKPELLAPFARVIVSLKFGRDVCSERLGCGPDYLGPIRERLLGLQAAGVPLLVRHLVMPGHLDCCLGPTITWLEDNLPQVPFTLLLGFIPPRQSQVPELRHALDPAERDAALALAGRSALCWEAAGGTVPTRHGPPEGPEYLDLVIDARGAICLPAVGSAAQALVAGLTAANEEERP